MATTYNPETGQVRPDCWIVVYGNPSDGFSFAGPWDNSEDAVAYGEDLHRYGVDWWVVEVQAPEATRG